MTKTKPLNALLAFNGRDPAFFSLDNELERLIRLHGKAAVKESVKRLTAMKKGRKPELDWRDLKDWIDLDARDWLDGNDPIALRSNYALAKAVSKAKPGHNQIATHRRILRKLAKRRTLSFLFAAWNIAESGRPFADYFRVCEALAASGGVIAQTVTSIADTHRGQIERYRGRFGDPDPSMSLAAIQEALKAPLLPASPLGILGLLGSKSG